MGTLHSYCTHGTRGFVLTIYKLCIILLLIYTDWYLKSKVHVCECIKTGRFVKQFIEYMWLVPKQSKDHHGFYIDCHCYRFLLLDKGHEAENLQKSVCFYCITASLWRTPVKYVNKVSRIPNGRSELKKRKKQLGRAASTKFGGNCTL